MKPRRKTVSQDRAAGALIDATLPGAPMPTTKRELKRQRKTIRQLQQVALLQERFRMWMHGLRVRIGAAAAAIIDGYDGLHLRTALLEDEKSFYFQVTDETLAALHKIVEQAAAESNFVAERQTAIGLLWDAAEGVGLAGIPGQRFTFDTVLRAMQNAVSEHAKEFNIEVSRGGTIPGIDLLRARFRLDVRGNS